MLLAPRWGAPRASLRPVGKLTLQGPPLLLLLVPPLAKVGYRFLLAL